MSDPSLLFGHDLPLRPSAGLALDLYDVLSCVTKRRKSLAMKMWEIDQTGRVSDHVQSTVLFSTRRRVANDLTLFSSFKGFGAALPSANT